MANCLLSLGSNLGDRGAHLQAALRFLSCLPQTTLLAQSSFRDTNPAGCPAAQYPFLNAAALLETSLAPHKLLVELQRIENELGRVRKERWGPRTIDLDLLLYDQLELESPELTLPHPRMSFRRFVLEPATEIAAEMVYPINGWTIQRLLQHLQPWNRLIVLKSIDSSATRLANEFDISLRTASSNKKEKPRWQITCKHTLVRAQIDCDLPGTFRAQPALVVVWQDQNAGLESLNIRRHETDNGPYLWIPGVSLEQARQEVIAAMAAME